jgi:hypothetical protein
LPWSGSADPISLLLNPPASTLQAPALSSAAAAELLGVPGMLLNDDRSGLVVVADSGLGYLDHLCAAKVAFVVPLRADT